MLGLFFASPGNRRSKDTGAQEARPNLAVRGPNVSYKVVLAHSLLVGCTYKGRDEMLRLVRPQVRKKFLPFSLSFRRVDCDKEKVTPALKKVSTSSS